MFRSSLRASCVRNFSTFKLFQTENAKSANVKVSFCLTSMNPSYQYSEPFKLTCYEAARLLENIHPSRDLAVSYIVIEDVKNKKHFSQMSIQPASVVAQKIHLYMQNDGNIESGNSNP